MIILGLILFSESCPQSVTDYDDDADADDAAADWGGDINNLGIKNVICTNSFDEHFLPMYIVVHSHTSKNPQINIKYASNKY